MWINHHQTNGAARLGKCDLLPVFLQYVDIFMVPMLSKLE